jgi:hypothetical protein
LPAACEIEARRWKVQPGRFKQCISIYLLLGTLDSTSVLAGWWEWPLLGSVGLPTPYDVGRCVVAFANFIYLPTYLGPILGMYRRLPWLGSCPFDSIVQGLVVRSVPILRWQPDRRLNRGDTAFLGNDGSVFEPQLHKPFSPLIIIFTSLWG